MRRLAFTFLVLIVYGSLYPFSDWRGSPLPAPALSFLGALPRHVDRADAVQNILAYLPFGLFLGAALLRSVRAPVALLVAGMAGGALSLAMECIQQYLPSRDPSVIDLILNIFGTLGGATLASFMRGHISGGARVLELRHEWVRGGTLPDLGLAAIALWVLSQTSPLVPSLDLGQLRSGLSQVVRALLDPASIDLSPSLTYAFYLAGLGLLARQLVRPDKPALRLFALLVGGVFVLKVIVQGRQLSGEALAGAALAFAFLALWPRLRADTAPPGQDSRSAWTAMLLLAAGFILSELTPGRDPRIFEFNWIPLVGQMRSLTGLQNILELFWPLFAIACFARGLCPAYRRAELALAGGVAVAVGVFALEWAQQGLAGRFGDITQVMLACAGWTMPWTFKGRDYEAGHPAGPARPYGQGAGARQ